MNERDRKTLARKIKKTEERINKIYKIKNVRLKEQLLLMYKTTIDVWKNELRPSDIYLDTRNRKIKVGRKEINITQREFELLYKTCNGYWVIKEYEYTSVRLTVSKLRKKCPLISLSTMRGVGYKLENTLFVM